MKSLEKEHRKTEEKPKALFYIGASGGRRWTHTMHFFGGTNGSPPLAAAKQDKTNHLLSVTAKAPPPLPFFSLCATPNVFS